MKFGAMVATKIDDWQLLQYAEELGYDHGWVPDSQMIWSDTYAVLALAAANTSRIRLGTGVAIAPTRLAPVTAHSIASINRIAPGRVFLGIGTGHTAMRVMGMKPMGVAAFGDYLRVVRGLLHGEEVEFTHDNQTRAIRFLHQDLGFVNVEQPVPMYVAANGPRTLALAGKYGDGRVSGGYERGEVFSGNMQYVAKGARDAGRELPRDFHTAELCFASVLEAGETLASDRVIDEVGSMVACGFHYWWELARAAGHENFIPPEVQDEWATYKGLVDKMETPPAKRYLEIHNGHCTFLQPAERSLVTPAMIRAVGGYVGEPDQIIEELRERERGGLQQVTLLPPMAGARENFRRFSEQVMARY